MKLVLTQILLITLFSIKALASPLHLTEEEKNFIQENTVVKIAMMPDFAPFTYEVNGKVVGFEHDLLDIISQKTGLTFEKHIDKWTTIYNAFKNKEVDVISSISYKEYREPFTLFSSSYYDIPIMIFVRDNFGEYNGLKSLTGKKVGVLKDVFYVNELENIGTMNLVYFDNYSDLTSDLVFGKIDALIQNLTNINYLIKKNVYSNITIASELILPNTTKEDLRLGISPEKPLLGSILQKAISSLTKQEKKTLTDRWIGVIKEYVGGHIELNKGETAYVNTQRIKYCINPTGLPFEGLSENGEHIGMSADYYSLFKRVLSAQFVLVMTESWSQSIDYIKNRECDMLALGMETSERKSYLNFTSSYLEVPLVVATRVDVPFINNILDLEGEKVGIVKGDAFVKILKNKYPSLSIIEVEDIYDGLDKVKSGQHFAYIDTLASIGYEFQSNYFGELKIAGKVTESLKLSVAVRKDDKTLLNILQKAINTITNESHRKILTKWVPIKFEKSVDYKNIWQIALVSILFIFLVIYWNIKITNANKLLKVAQKDIEEKNKALNQLAVTDKLTDLFNRRKIEEIIQAELNRKERFKHSFCLSILDIDHFKKVNDVYGHQQGDRVLIEISSILKSNLRKTDFVGRYGGEEFILIFPESSVDSIFSIIEDIRQKIATKHFEGVGHKTASFGVATSYKGDTVEKLINRADRALYIAKNNGRNKIVTHEAEIADKAAIQ